MSTQPAPPRVPPARPAPPLARWRDGSAVLAALALAVTLPVALVAPGWATLTVTTAALGGAASLALHAALRYLRDLEHRQDALVTALTEATRARQADQVAAAHRSSFLDSVGSQLATSVEGARHMTETLLQSGVTGVPAHCGHALRSTCENLGALVDELLDLRDLEQGQLTTRAGPFDPGAVVEETLDSFAAGSRAEGVRLVPHVRGSTPARVDGDGRRFRQLLLHLVHQSVRSCPGGCLVVELAGTPVGLQVLIRGQGFVVPEEIRRARPADRNLTHVARLVAALDAHLLTDGDRITVEVPVRTLVGPTAAPAPRHGVVVAWSEVAEVSTVIADYARSFQLSPVIAASRSEVERHVAVRSPAAVICGDAGVEPIPGVPWINLQDTQLGTAGTGILRRADLFDALLRDLPANLSPVDTPLRVLLVDDNAVNRLVARKFVERMGYAVDEAENGREAVDMAKAGNYAAILMDLQMPVMNGLEATREIRRQLLGAAPPIIAVTANVQASDRQQSLASGMVEHLGKPLDHVRLRDTLDRWIQPLRRTG